MKYFLLKRPAGLAFIQEEYSPGDSVPSTNQIRMWAGKSNAKLVQTRDGSWYIRTGEEMHRLKSVSTKDSSIIRLTENGGEFISKIDKKWFIEKKSA
ncbi:hypothetical protein PAEPH01_2536 [Pancytospora epiphaga]|nr:hypothetical protein PAEPH01_2536 [Pancytospora epiphaga]